MGMWERFGRGLDEVTARCREVVAQAITFTTFANSSSDGDTDFVEGYQTETDEPPMPQHRVRRLSSWGITGRPMPGVLAGVVRALGGAAQGLLVGVATPAYGRQDLAEGETQVFNRKDGCEVYLDEDGANNINSFAGQDVIVNGGTLEVARKTDPVRITAAPAGALAAWMAQVETAINLLAGGSITPLSTTFIASPGMTINGGATRFKA
jgi:hypothetical protein